MSLSGNLGFVSLDEVLRLLTRSDQLGSVDVKGEGVHGRIFVTKGGVALATTSDDDGMRRHLSKSGLVDSDYLEGGESLAPTVEKSGGALIDLLREMTVESIYQLGLKGETFEVFEGQKTAFASPKVFELENLLGDAKRRLTDWTEVSKTVKDLHQKIHFNRDLGERDEVNVDADSWKVLSEIGSGSSVSEIAEELGTTEFWTARIAAKLAKDDLVTLEKAPVVEEPEEQVATEYTEPVTAEDDDLDPTESWWEEPQDEVEETEVEEQMDDVAVVEETEEPQVEKSSSIFGAYKPRAEEPTESVPAAEESQAQIPTLVEETDSAEVEEDTEAFLEKVFSELDSSDETEEEGYGLLRRRRMGAIRDASSDS